VNISSDIKTDEDLDINDKHQMDYFAYAYNIVQSIERIWGVGSIRMWSVSGKICMQPRT
jgi:hypothetical protein